MRYIALDTETTGLNYHKGERLVEVGCVEIINNEITGNTFHRYINPRVRVGEYALKVHGLSNEFLADKPLFSEVASDLIDFIGTDKLVIHNAQFDMGFLRPSFSDAGYGEPLNPVLCTLQYARHYCNYPNNKLDTIAEEMGISSAEERGLHGALKDAEILSKVFLRLKSKDKGL